MATDCCSLKAALLDHLTARVAVQQVRDICIATLPMLTIDGRFVDVFVEPRNADYFLIHDAGKAVNELILQGMKISPSVERDLASLAGRFGIAYSDEMFQTGARIGDVAKQAYAVAMCSALAMTHLLEHETVIEEEPVHNQLGAALRRWSRRRAKVEEDVRVDGELKQHSFDFLVQRRKAQPIAVSVLNPTAGALSAAERFGFKVKDLESTDAGKWKRVAVETKSEVWSMDARSIVEKCASEVIQIPSGTSLIYAEVANALDRAAA